MNFTLVCGVDAAHLKQLACTWPTWVKYKPSLLKQLMIVFRDKTQVTDHEVRTLLGIENLSVYEWPMGVTYEGKLGNRWENPQRYKMLAGFVHIPALFVKTPYWLKLDTDVFATGQDDWIDPKWFNGNPAIIGHRWWLTKPTDLFLRMDQWVDDNKEKLPEWVVKPPLDLRPKPGKDCLVHKRIISWCSFFHTGFTKVVAKDAEKICGSFKLPIPSQDGFLWYAAKRIGWKINRPSMKERGWMWSNDENYRQVAEELKRNDN